MTGHGEMFLRLAAAHQVCARVLYGGSTLEAAARAVIHEELTALRGRGGLIAIGTGGELVFQMNAPAMYRGSIDVDGRLSTAIFDV